MIFGFKGKGKGPKEICLCAEVFYSATFGVTPSSYNHPATVFIANLMQISTPNMSKPWFSSIKPDE